MSFHSNQHEFDQSATRVAAGLGGIKRPGFPSSIYEATPRDGFPTRSTLLASPGRASYSQKVRHARILEIDRHSVALRSGDEIVATYLACSLAKQGFPPRGTRTCAITRAWLCERFDHLEVESRPGHLAEIYQNSNQSYNVIELKKADRFAHSLLSERTLKSAS